MTASTPAGSPSVGDELRRIVPTEQVEPHYDLEQGLGGSFAVEPASEAELVDLLRWANRRRAVVYTRHPRAGDAERCGPRTRIYLRGQRMARIEDVDLISGTATVQSGVRMDVLHQKLAERGYTTGFPSRPWREESLGSILAASLDAHWGPPWGSPERQVVSLGVVLPDGTPASSRRVPRRAVGPDFDRLFLGSRGRYGIIHRVTLRIYPSSARVVLTYAASDLRHALRAIRLGFERGLTPRAVEVLTPAPDRAWGRKRVGLTERRPVLVLAEPWGRQSDVSGAVLDEHLAEELDRLEPPVGWDVHEGLLPPPRQWVAPVVGLPWSELERIAGEVGHRVPPGLWMVRMNRHGAHVSLAHGAHGDPADRVRAILDRHERNDHPPWEPLRRAIKHGLDPEGILNPDLEPPA